MDLNKNGIDDIEEIKKYVADKTTDLMTGVAHVWDWVKAEAARIEALFEGSLQTIKDAVLRAIGSAEADPKTIGEIVADTLNIIAREATHLLEEVKSEFLIALTGLLHPGLTPGSVTA
jgi:hypothetical protein